MQSPDPKYLLAEAKQLMETAENELRKAEEDVVVPLVCYHSRRSLANVLRAYLMLMGSEPESFDDLSILLKACGNHDPRFLEIDLTRMACHHSIREEGYCTSLDQVKACMNLAKQAKEIVIED